MEFTTVLNLEDNDLLTRVEGDWPMGRLMRRYWMPVILSQDLTAGGAPRRLSVLGEKLVAFRDSSGQAGLLDEACPHRGASLALARNADCALQCIYHGWKVDRNGAILATPSEPADSTFKDRVRHVAYPVKEAGGLVWAFLGAPADLPAFPDFPWTARPPEHSFIMCVQQQSNWAQAVEGAVDSAHVSFLHTDYAGRISSGRDVYTGGGASLLSKVTLDGHPRLEAENTPWGFRYGAIRAAVHDGRDVNYVRVTQFVAPFWTLIPTRPGWVFQLAFVPVDDDNTMIFNVAYRTGAPIDADERQSIRDWQGLDDLDEEYRLAGRGLDNLWGQDREAMTAGRSFSGLGGYAVLEDIAVQDSMGPRFDRSREHLGTSDVAVIRWRRIMIAAARGLDRGDPLPALGGDFDHSAVRAEEAIIDPEASWTTVGLPRRHPGLDASPGSAG